MSTEQGQDLSNLLQRVLEQYPIESIGEGISDHVAQKLLSTTLPDQVRELIPNSERFDVHGSPGQGRWTAIPWVAIRDPQESESIQQGIYVVFLFEPQNEQVFLTLNQGVEQIKEERGMSEAREELRRRAGSIRRVLDPAGFTADELDFEYASSRNQLYGPGTIFYREYSIEDLTDESGLEDDFRRLVETYERFIDSREDILGWKPSEEWEYRALWLRDRYQDARDWDIQKRSAEQTSAAVQQLAEALVESSDTIETDGLTALFRLCQHSDQIRVETKRKAVQELDIPNEVKEDILSNVDETIGTVGGPNFNQEIPDAETGRRVHDILATLLSSDEKSELDAAVAKLATENIPGLQSGSLSPILHYLHPTKFPVINRQATTGVKRYFNETVTKDFEAYPEYCKLFREIRDRYGFKPHFRDLDYFFIWGNQKGTKWDHDWTWMLTDEGETTRDTYAIQPGTSGSDGGPDMRPTLWPAWRDESIITVGGEDGDLRTLSDEERQSKGDSHGWGATEAWETFMEMSPGDVIVVKYGQTEFRAIGVVEPDSYEYETDGPGYKPLENGDLTKYPHIRSIEWVATNDDGWGTDAIGLDRQFARDTAYEYDYFEELRYKLAPTQDDGVELFESLEAVSRGYSGEPATQFSGSTTPLPPTEHQILDRKEPPAIDIEQSELFGTLYYPDADQLANQIIAALRAGKHIVFTGPPGTGKTELAENVSQALVDLENSPFTGYQLTTATADWTTFDTVGGRMPKADTDDLVFSPGIVLERFKRNGRQQNDLLIIDELNRADIDKAFGQLFTVLSGQRVQLPFEREGSSIEILPAGVFQGRDPDPHQYVVPATWRLFATMNSYDKTTLYEMSYAFMRRLAFINVGIPNLETDAVTDTPVQFMAPYLAGWFDTEREAIESGALEEDENLPDVADVRAAVDVWQTLSTGEHVRPIGPAIVRDMLELMRYHDSKLGDRLADAISAYVFSQLEGIPERKDIVKEICELDALGDRSESLRKTAETVLDISINRRGSDGNQS